jgi:hypothetical protein
MELHTKLSALSDRGYIWRISLLTSDTQHTLLLRILDYENGLRDEIEELITICQRYGSCLYRWDESSHRFTIEGEFLLRVYLEVVTSDRIGREDQINLCHTSFWGRIEESK